MAAAAEEEEEEEGIGAGCPPLLLSIVSVFFRIWKHNYCYVISPWRHPEFIWFDPDSTRLQEVSDTVYNQMVPDEAADTDAISDCQRSL